MQGTGSEARPANTADMVTVSKSLQLLGTLTMGTDSRGAEPSLGVGELGWGERWAGAGFLEEVIFKSSRN